MVSPASTLNVPRRGEAAGYTEGRGEKNSLFPDGPVIKCFIIPPNSKIENNCEKMIFLTPTVAVLAERAAVKPSYASVVYLMCFCNYESLFLNNNC